MKSFFKIMTWGSSYLGRFTECLQMICSKKRANKMAGHCKFNVFKDVNSLEIFFRSTIENIDKADTETRRFLNEMELDCESFAICLLMREGLNNAVKHGHFFDSDKMVRYSLKVRYQSLIMEIEDHGEGFDWRAMRKRQMPADAEHGRGFAIMEQYSSEFRYNYKGNKLILKKKIKKDDF